MEKILRRAQLSDIDELQRLLEQIARHHRQGRVDIFKDNVRKYSREELAGILTDKERPIFVAENDKGGIAGYVFCIHRHIKENAVLTDREVLYIDDFCVDEDVRGQSIGGKLFEAIKEYALSLGIVQLELNVWEFNEGAMRFYERCGFKTQKRQMEMSLNSDKI